jgi:hypothetical protein
MTQATSQKCIKFGSVGLIVSIFLTLFLSFFLKNQNTVINILLLVSNGFLMIISISILILGFIFNLKNKKEEVSVSSTEVTPKKSNKMLRIGLAMLLGAGPLGGIIFFISYYLLPFIGLNALVIAISTISVMIFGFIVFIIGFLTS